MEYAKDEVYTVKYTESKDKLKVHEERNRLVFFLVTLGVIFSIINFVLIFNFFDILTRI